MIASGGFIAEGGFSSSWANGNVADVKGLGLSLTWSAPPEDPKEVKKEEETPRKEGGRTTDSELHDGYSPCGSGGFGEAAPTHWFDNAACCRAQRQWLQKVEHLDRDLQAATDDASKILIETQSVKEDPFFKNTWILVQNRAECARLVLEGPEEALTKYVGSWVSGPGKEAAAEAAPAPETKEQHEHPSEVTDEVGPESEQAQQAAAQVEPPKPAEEDEDEEERKSTVLIDSQAKEKTHDADEGRDQNEVTEESAESAPAPSPALASTASPPTPAPAPPERVAQGQAPSQNLEDLRTISVMRDMGNDFLDCLSAQEIAELNASVKIFLSTSRKLLTALKASVTELTKASGARLAGVERNEKEKAQAELAARKRLSATLGMSMPSPMPDAKKRKGATTMDILAGAGVQIKKIGSQEFDCLPADWAWLKLEDDITDLRPYIVIACVQCDLESGEDKVMESLKHFMKDFKGNPLRETAQRAMRFNRNDSQEMTDADDFILNKLLPFLPTGCVTPPGFPRQHKFAQMKQSSGLCDFGLKENSFHAVTDRDNLWSVRVGVVGYRNVALVSQEDVTSELKKKAIFGVTAKDYMKTLGEAGAKSLLDSVRVYVGMLGPGDLLFTPANMITLETVGSEDCFGLKANVWLKRDSKGMAFFRNFSEKASTPSTHPVRLVVEGVNLAQNSSAGE